MNTCSFVQRVFAVGIILLFIGVAVTSGIYGEFIKETTNNKLINIKVEFFKNIKKESQNVSLVNRTYQQLLLYLDSLEQRLSKIKTRTETMKVFEEALTYFDSIGLFGSNSIEKVQELVFSKNEAVQ